MAASLTAPPQDGPRPLDAVQPHASPDPVNILLVDDQPARLLAYRAILEPLGENLVEASSGTAALKALMEGEFGLILLDVNMPGMDGFETASLIHQHPRFEKTPIIFVTAVNVSDMDRMRGYKLGAVDYVMVPIIPEILRSKVMVLAELYRKRRELQLANESLAAANAALQLEKARELDVLNESLRIANTQLASRNDELQAQVSERVRAQERLLELDRRKDEFLATLAHELRNPLASLGNAINVLKLVADAPPGTGTTTAGDAGAPDTPLHDTMQRQMGLLVRLIDDLLDVARINQGKLTLQPQATSVQAVLDTAIETAQPLLQAGGHTLGVHVPAQPIALHADRDRLAQVFCNLLNNAVKYSDPGTPIELRVDRSDDAVAVTVADRGIGLEPAHAGDIFDLFTQVDTSVERARGGLGIGLTLVKRIVEMHGGRVQADSDGLGHGSRFSVRLPLSQGPDARAAVIPPDSAPSAAAPLHAPARCRALVIDDNRDSADTLAMMLELLGHDTQRVYEPQAALAAAHAFAPDIVFLDIGMPGLSGYDVAGLLRAAPGGQSLVLVAVTGWGQPDDRRRTLEAGFDYHLVKPPEMAAITGICNALPRRATEGDGDA